MTEAADEAARAPAPADGAPEGDFGTALRAARESVGMSVGSLAGRLRLHPKQVDALERGDLAALPALIYVRGFVRGCARELKIDPAPLLADLDRRAGTTPGDAIAAGGNAFPLARFGDGSRAIMTAVLGILLIAGAVGALIPRHHAASGALPTQPAAPVLPEPSEAPPAADAAHQAAPAGTPPPAIDANSAPKPDTATRHPPAPVAPQALPAPAAPSGANDAAANGAANGAANSAAIAAAATSTPPSTEPAAPLPAPELVLHVREISWVEVVGSNGTLLAQICPAGSVQQIRGKAPFRIVIGNAAAVDAQFRGVAVDIGRYANVNGVARFTLE